MKTLTITLLSLTFLLLISIGSSAQSTIVQNDKNQIKAQIIEITSEVIKYKPYDHLDGPIRNINISEVFMVIYENGKFETFNQEKPKPQTPVTNVQTASEPTVTTQLPVTQPISPTPVTYNETPTNSGFVNHSSSANINSKPSASDEPLPATTAVESPKIGWSFGAKIGGYVPTNKYFKGIYKPGLSYGLNTGYWGNDFAIEAEWKNYTKEGNPYEYGDVDHSSSKVSMNWYNVSLYWLPYSSSTSCIYLGGGLGKCSLKESAEMSAYDETISGSENISTWAYHSTVGARFKPINIELMAAFVPFENTYTGDEIDYGGVFVTFGVFF
ncbi:MAG: hypothetical protein JXP36_03625 [Bacteroidales bacterium]|nr:hypothetical protein [Bacteroidales bacterium]